MANQQNDSLGWGDLSSGLRAAIIACALLLILVLIFVVVFAFTVGGGGGTRPYNTPQFLLAATSVSLLFWSIVVAVLAFIGWRRIEEEIETQAKAAIDDEAERVRREFSEVRGDIRGNVYLTAGVIYGRLSIRKGETELDVVEPDYLRLSINQLDRALELFKDEDSIQRAKNNLAFSYALGGSAEHGPAAKRYALELREDPVSGTDPAYLNTYARVVSVYYDQFDDPRKTVKQAGAALEAMLDNPDVTTSEKANARRHLSALNRALENLRAGEAE